MIQERKAQALNGFPVLFVLLVATVVPIGAVVFNVADVGSQISSGPRYLHIGIITYVVLIGLAWRGLTPVNPNEARALVLFGNYAGTLKRAGPPVGQPVHRAAQDLGPRPQLRDVRSSRSTTTTATRSRSRRSSSGR